MADTVIGARLQLDGEGAKKSMKEFKQEIRAANEELLNTRARFGEASKETFEAAKKVALLKDAIKDANETVDLFDPGNKFKAVGNSVTGLLGGFTALTGAIGLLGVESKEVQKQLLKVQSALALSQGLSVVNDSIKDFKRLATVISTQVAGAFRTLRNAIISTGIGALIVAVGVLIANFDKIKESLFGVSRAAKAAAKSAEEGAIAEEKKLEAIGDQENLLRLSGKTEDDIRKIKIAQTNEVIAQREQQLLASQELARSQVEAAERNRRILKGIIDFLTKPIKLINDTVGKISAFFGGPDIGKGLEKVRQETNETIANFFFDPNEVKKEGDEAVAELKSQILRLKNERAGFILAGRGKGVEADPGKIKRDSVATDPAVALEIKKNNFIVNANRLKNQEIITSDNLRTAYEKANAAVRAYEAEQEALAKIEAAKSVGNALGALSDLVGRQTAAGKALGIAQATINMWVGVTEVLRNKTVIPEPFGTIQKVASIATIIASGLSAIKNIVKVNVPGAGGGGGGSVSAPLQAVPTVTNTRLDSGQLNQIGNAANPVRAFVVEHDITTNQERIRRLNRAARI